MKAIGAHEVGERVAVRTSAVQLSLASMIVFGVPVLTVVLTMLVWESVWALGVALLLSFTAVYLVMRFARLRMFLRIYADSL